MGAFAQTVRPGAVGWVDAGMAASAVAVGLRRHGAEAPALLRAFAARSRWFQEGFGPRKYVKVRDRWLTRFVAPSWPSPCFDRWVEGQLDTLAGRGTGYLAQLQIAVSARCPVGCDFCSAADELGHEEPTSVEKWIDLVATAQGRGLMQLHLTGGEPLLRYAEVLELVRSVDPTTEVWLNTSGLGLTPDRAAALARAGLFGVCVSLDAVDPGPHDARRTLVGSHAQALAACRAAVDAGLVLVPSLVAARGVRAEALDRYADLAESLGAAFVRVLEPQPAGRARGGAAALDAQDRAVLEAWEDRSNTDPALRTRPPVVNQQRVGRRMGCLLGGDLGFYVDARGRAHACPFCGSPGPDVFAEGLDAAVAALRASGCHAVDAARTWERFPPLSPRSP